MWGCFVLWYLRVQIYLDREAEMREDRLKAKRIASAPQRSRIRDSSRN
jgi:hypothetical protein